MDTGVSTNVDRRRLLERSAFVGLGLFLAGCAGSRRGSGLPGGDLWTGKGRDWQKSQVRPAPPAAARPAPAAVVSGVVPRAEWAARGPKLAETEAMNGVRRITIHHDGMPPVLLRTKMDVASRLELIRRAHVEHQGWADIGYHYIVDPAGRVWEGRPISRQGAHVKDQNPHNVGVMVLGNFEEQRPTGEAVSTLGQFVRSLMDRHRVTASNVRSHQELASTVCPGRHLQAQLNNARARGGALAG